MKTIAIGSKTNLFNGLGNQRYKNLTIPNLITYGTLTFSLAGIYLLLNTNYFLGALILWTSCDIFDTLDGYIAKKFKMFSPLGADLDSLVDVIAFLIPPFLIALQFGNQLLMISASLFVFSGIYRLARFNVEKNAKGVVVGLQASLAAHLIYFSLLINVPSPYLFMVFLLLSFLMISPIMSKGKFSLYLTGLLVVLNLLLAFLKML